MSKRLLMHLIAVGVLSAVAILLLLQLMPTHDDWTYMTAPYVLGSGMKLEYFCPQDSYWRPFDVLIGVVETRWTFLFPALNHVLIYVLHLTNTVLAYRLCRRFGCSHPSSNVAALVYIFSAAAFGTVLGVDSVNQALNATLGMTSLLLYLDGYLGAWLCVALCATFAKENGIVHFVLPPAIHYFLLSETRAKDLRKRAFCHVLMGLGVAAAYGLARTMLAVSTEVSEAYTGLGVAKMAVNVFRLLLPTVFPVDYVSAMYAPKRNLLLFGITLLSALPFVFYLLRTMFALRRTSRLWQLAVLWLCCVSIHVLTIVSSMHSYSGLWVFAVLVAWCLDQQRCRKAYVVLYLAAALFSLGHHYVASYESGRMGQRMAQQAVAAMGNEHPDRLAVITIGDDNPKYSSFCVAPSAAFGWGLATRRATDYTWPTEMDCLNVETDDAARIEALADSVQREGIQTVWLVRGDSVLIIRR